MFSNTGKTVSLWLCTTRAVSSVCGCTELVGCCRPGSLSIRSRKSWMIHHPHNLERRSWELLLLETGIPAVHSRTLILDSVHVLVICSAHYFFLKILMRPFNQTGQIQLTHVKSNIPLVLTKEMLSVKGQQIF